MYTFQILVLKIIRKVYLSLFKTRKGLKPKSIQDPDVASQIIHDALVSDQPCMIARFGAFELATLANYIGILGGVNVLEYIKSNQAQWWWQESLITAMNTNAGFFPPTVAKIEQFCELMIEDIPEVDVLGSWLAEEKLFEKELVKAKKIRFLFLDPYWSNLSWTRALEGKKILVVHPFKETIEKQYLQREVLFSKAILPLFELKTIQSVQSIAGSSTPFQDWFEALEFMKSEIDKHNYDICLIGCGAYGFPLAAHVKRSGKKAIQLGGSLQLLFGIKGNRWDKNYSKDYDYSTLLNQHWVKPSEKETPVAASSVENACYW